MSQSFPPAFFICSPIFFIAFIRGVTLPVHCSIRCGYVSGVFVSQSSHSFPSAIPLLYIFAFVHFKWNTSLQIVDRCAISFTDMLFIMDFHAISCAFIPHICGFSCAHFMPFSSLICSRICAPATPVSMYFFLSSASIHSCGHLFISCSVSASSGTSTLYAASASLSTSWFSFSVSVLFLSSLSACPFTHSISTLCRQ